VCTDGNSNLQLLGSFSGGLGTHLQQGFRQEITALTWAHNLLKGGTTLIA